MEIITLGILWKKNFFPNDLLLSKKWGIGGVVLNIYCSRKCLSRNDKSNFAPSLWPLKISALCAYINALLITARCCSAITPENMRKSKDFLMFSEGIDKQHRTIMVKEENLQTVCKSLTHFWPMLQFHIPWKHQKTSVFSGQIPV